MENLSQLYNQHHFDYSDIYSPTGFSSSSSASNVTSTVCSSSSSRANNIIVSDEEVMLASSHPKKRAGRKKFRETRHPVYRGVRKRNSGKWVCEVREPNSKSRIWLGTYETAYMAARAHDVAAIALRGRSACLNFADSTCRLPIPASSDVKDIQRAAAEAAEMFGPCQEQSDGANQDDLVIEENETSFPENRFYTEDDEAVFSMPELLADMAEGLMLPPPHCAGDEHGTDDVEISGDISLWSYSM